MLILTRRIQESLFLDGKRITITVLGIKGHQVRLGINAPKEVSVHREEVYERIQQEQQKHEQPSHFDKDADDEDEANA